MAATPKSFWPWVRALLHPVYDQPDATSVHAQFDQVLDALADKLPRVAEHLEAARADVLAFILPDRDALICLVGAVLAEQHDEWIEGRRYLGLDALARCRTLSARPHGSSQACTSPPASRTPLPRPGRSQTA